MSESPAAEELPIEAYGLYPPGTIVLAKLKSFPPWPGIVIPNELIPPSVLQSKPKSKPIRTGSAGRGGRGRKVHRGRRAAAAAATAANAALAAETLETNNEVNDSNNIDDKLWCVRFLRDDTFMWATSSDISLLEKEAIEKYLKNNTKGKKTIKGAYEMALNPPDLEEFIIYGSDGKPIDVNNEADDEDFREESLEEDEEDDDENNEDEEEEELDSEIDEDEKEINKPKSRKKRTTSTSPKKKPKTQPPPKKKARGRPPASAKKAKIIEEPETSGDEDWEGDLYEDTDSIAIDIPYSKDLQIELKSYTSLLKKFKTQLLILFSPIGKEEASDFLIDSKDIKSFSSLFDTIYNNEDVPPIALLKHFGINRILFSILKQPIWSNKKELVQLRQKLSSFVEDLFDLVIEVDENWSYKEPEKVEEVKEEVKEEEEIKEEKGENHESTNGDSKIEVEKTEEKVDSTEQN